MLSQVASNNLPCSANRTSITPWWFGHVSSLLMQRCPLASFRNPRLQRENFLWSVESRARPEVSLTCALVNEAACETRKELLVDNRRFLSSAAMSPRMYRRKQRRWRIQNKTGQLTSVVEWAARSKTNHQRYFETCALDVCQIHEANT